MSIDRYMRCDKCNQKIYFMRNSTVVRSMALNWFLSQHVHCLHGFSIIESDFDWDNEAEEVYLPEDHLTEDEHLFAWGGRDYEQYIEDARREHIERLEEIRPLIEEIRASEGYRERRIASINNESLHEAYCRELGDKRKIESIQWRKKKIEDDRLKEEVEQSFTHDVMEKLKDKYRF